MRVNRREFVERLGAAATTSAFAGSLRPAANAQHREAVSPHVRTDDLCFKSGRELARLIRARKVSAREVMAAHLRQIERLNPSVNAIVAKLDDARCLALAEDADRRFAASGPDGPLHGLPRTRSNRRRSSGADAPPSRDGARAHVGPAERRSRPRVFLPRSGAG